LQDIEAKILKLVADAPEDILADEELIDTLDQSKQTSIAINERMVEADKTAEMISENREFYRPIARRGSVLYFVIADLSLIDPMYQYSLEFFARLFNRRLEKAEKSDVLEERIQILLDDIINSTYLNICRGLFEKDKLLYSFLNTASLVRKAGGITNGEWGCYLRGSTTDFSNKVNECDYLDADTFKKILGLEEAHANFKDLHLSFEDAADAITWKKIIVAMNPTAIPMPALFEEKLSPFQKLMLIRALKETKFIYAVKAFVLSELGPTFIESPPFDLEGSSDDSTNVTPIIFVLSPGADPIADLVALAKLKGMQDRLKILSLG
jgi:dynein heavy chain